eukprot:gene26750-33376_t
MKGEYFLFHDGIEDRDIRQGALGDCWFLCAIAAMTEFPELVKDLFPSHEVNTAGVYNVRFCKNGFWQTVRVDDYFPCYPGGGPIYSRSNGNELWVLLLEKAYSKLCGSYEAIKSGWAYEGMMDLTGAPYKTVRLDDPDSRSSADRAELWRQLLHYDEEKYIMSASTHGEDVYTETGTKPGKDGNGLICGHAYTLISALTLRSGVKLVRLRNPWGDTEWNGAWSDHSSLWKPDTEAEVGGHTKEDDGSFWMSFEDMLRFFYSVNVCMTRRKGRKRPWIEDRRKFTFDYSTRHTSEEVVSDGKRVTCPHFTLSVTAPGTFIVSVHQEDVRCAKARPYIDFGVSVLKLTKEIDPQSQKSKTTYNYVTGTGSTVERQNQTDEVQLEVGEYLVVPTSTGIKLREHYKQYLSTVDANKIKGVHGVERIRLTTRDSRGKAVFAPEVLRVYEELFTHLDFHGDGYLTKDELDQYLVSIGSPALTPDGYAWLLDTFEAGECRAERGLSLAGFNRMQLFVFTQKDGGDEEKLWREFEKLGYDEHLRYESGRSAALVVHATGQYMLSTCAFDETAARRAVELPVIERGSCTQFAHHQVQLYKYRSSYAGVSFVVRNSHPTKPALFILDCTQSRNVTSNHSSLVAQKHIPAGETRVMCHLMPTDSNSGWSWSHSAEAIFE